METAATARGGGGAHGKASNFPDTVSAHSRTLSPAPRSLQPFPLTTDCKNTESPARVVGNEARWMDVSVEISLSAHDTDLG